MEHSQKHICIFTQSHLARAPRVVKEANVYAKAGYKVTVYASWHDQKLLDTDKMLLEPSITYKAGSNLLDWNGVPSKILRLKRLTGRLLVRYLGIQTKSALGYGFNRYLNQLEQEKADVYIGHQEMGMALSKALIVKGKKVVFDFEDWHSKDLLPNDRVYRPIQLLEHLEKYLLEKASYCYTTSEAMAMALSDSYKTKKPYTIYNSFFASQRNEMDGLEKDVRHHETLSVFWFSQVIGKGRGLELLFDALPMVKTPFQLHLRGAISDAYRTELILNTPNHIELLLHDLVSPDELISRIAEHDLGLAFEESKPESRNYTITNKVFHYLQAGIPMLATKTAGQMEVASKSPEAIRVVRADKKDIAKTLDHLLGDVVSLKLGKESSMAAGATIFAFENQATKLLRMLNDELTF